MVNTYSLIGGELGGGAGPTFQAHDPATGAALEPVFHAANAADLDRAAALAATAFLEYGRRSGAEKGAFLRAIAAQMEAIAPALMERAGRETALPPGRLQSETARTCQQLRLFAELVEEGSWVDARLDRAAEPAGARIARKPDLRSLRRPLGPVAVFGASNFPLAFSVAGSDTASALAAGNPVLVKAHPAHPGTSALAGAAIQAAVRECGMPAGVFSLLLDAGVELGVDLVRHPLVRAVGFTGSLAAGRSLMDLAAARPEPIPVFAEMGSANPIFILPQALAARGMEIATGLHASVTLGAGQFCTKPGVVLAPRGEGLAAFTARLAELTRQSPAFTLLTQDIARRYQRGIEARRGQTGVQSLTPAATAGSTAAMVFETDAATFLSQPSLGEELFGPATVVIHHGGKEELLQVARALGGHLTATVHGTEEDLRQHAELLPLLEARVGRLVINGFPTGVEVTPAMVHGGPYPAASQGESSVGTRAITRFTRPVCFQDAPAWALPAELQDENPLGIWRRLDGRLSRESRRRSYRSRGRAVRRA